ncbi:2,3,4,5-tetrahydropyridine-2,6-dicarboxylate N-succinyltransferase [bacterium]|nr:2,3,4,5-tetrahydropyridine-2,6-dicarboxylate N-succinyltransferase [bacterium]
MSDFEKVLEQLESGAIRAASFVEGEWKANTGAKEAILAAFRAGTNVAMGPYIDKNTIPARTFTPEDGVRLVPRGSAVRRGAYVAPGVIIMPPSYINIGAYVDQGSMVDSHVLVGSCAQIGKNVHLSAGVQIGGVLEPIGQRPVVIEDNVFVGAGAVIVEGIVVKKGAVLAAGVKLSKGVPVYDCVNERRLEKGEDIPENAVVVPGTRPVNPSMGWAKEQNLQISCALIVKYRDAKSETSLTLEEALR